jgi:hypothetical protein
MKSEGSDLGYGGFEGQQAEGAQEEGLLHLQRRVIGKTRTGWVLFFIHALEWSMDTTTYRKNFLAKKRRRPYATIDAPAALQFVKIKGQSCSDLKSPNLIVTWCHHLPTI